MSKIPCRKCPKCGLYHDISAIVCNECGSDLKEVPAVAVEMEDIPGELFEEIEKKVPVFVQKCPVCGTLNFTPDKEDKITICYKCNKRRIASIPPMEYQIDTERGNKAVESVGLNEDAAVALKEQSANFSQNTNILFDDEEDIDVETQNWLNNIKNGIGSALSASDRSLLIAEVQQGKEIVNLNHRGILSPASENSETDEDDKDVVDWDILDGTAEPEKNDSKQMKREITLTAIRYERLSFTIKAEPGKPYMLGRSANQSVFLSKDVRVGNEHCYLIFRDGFWYVKDNHSRNGTAVNAEDIGENGEHILHDGDELRLGHHPDSMAFRITL